MKSLSVMLVLFLMAGCTRKPDEEQVTSCRYARYFDVVAIAPEPGRCDSLSCVVTVSPFDGHRDTLAVREQMDNIICLSSSHIACLSAIGKDDVISAVSGLEYITDPDIVSRQVPDIGYETSLDYEKIITLNPDLLVAYTVSAAEPPYLSRLRSLGVPVMVLYDHLEHHPLARAEYIRLFGVLTGVSEKADSVFDSIAESYEALAREAAEVSNPVKVLMNIPYGDAWYVPGGENYMSHLVRDAGGVVLGSVPGKAVSGTVSIEEAYMLSLEADVWLDPGHCRSREELASFHPLFPYFGPLKNGLPIYNNTLRTTPGGGNDFWESGAVRPDIILNDLCQILSGKENPSLTYFVSLD